MRDFNHSFLRAVTDLAIVCGLITSVANRGNAAVSFDTRVLTGDAAPGTGPDIVFSDFAIGSVVIDSDGETAFLGYVSGPGVTGINSEGIWSEGDGALELVARTFNVAPGMGGLRYQDLFTPRMNNSGETAFFGIVDGPGTATTEGVWAERGGSLGLVARQNQNAPGTSSGVVYSFLGRSFVFNDSGQTAFSAGLSGTGVNPFNNFGVWSEGGGSLEKIIREGEAAVGTAPGIVYGRQTFFEPAVALNGAGETAYLSFLTGPGLDFRNDQGIWSNTSGSLHLVVREGDPAAGMGPDATYLSLNLLSQSRVLLNSAGQVAFYASVDDPESDADHNDAIWAEEGGSLRIVAQSGGEAADAGPDVVYEDTNLRPLFIDDAGRVAYMSSISGPGVDDTNDFGIWSELGGSPALVVREGDEAPGTDPDVVFTGFIIPTFNQAGQIAFAAELTGPGIDDSNNRGIWMSDLNGNLQLVARVGDQMDVNDDPLIEDLRTVGSLDLYAVAGGEEGRSTSFNDTGQLAFHVYFFGGSEGIVVATVDTVPEPSVLYLAMLSGLSAMSSRRRFAHW